MKIVTNLDGCELGPIRPPSEASSLLIRLTRNCPWNKCAFCAVYKRSRFSKRNEETVIAEIDLLADAADRIRHIAADRDPEGRVTARRVMEAVNDHRATDEERRVALWLNRGGKNVFLQDADSLVRPAARIIPVLKRLRERFPSVDRVTTYARSRTLCARSPQQLRELRAAGLTRIHVGVESGSDQVLELVAKGCRGEHHVEGCRRAIDAGFEVCCYVMPGLGGRALSEEHARETARVLRAIDPHHIRLRTLWIDRGSPLEEIRARGQFEMLEEHEIVAEILELLRGLEGATGRLISDHHRNLLPDLEGDLVDDHKFLVRACERFIELDPAARDAYVVARRSGYFRTLDYFLEDQEALGQFTVLARQLVELGEGSLLAGMERGMGQRRM